MSSKKILGQLLLESKLVNEEQLEKALQVQNETGERLGRILINLGIASKDDIMRMLEVQLGVKSPVSRVELNPRFLNFLPGDIIKKYRVFPVGKDGDRLKVAMARPLDLDILDNLRSITGNEVEPVFVEKEQIENAVQEYLEVEKEQGPDDFEILNQETLQVDQPGEEAVNKTPVVQLVNSIIAGAVNESASDIHIEPRENTFKVRFRVDGVLRDYRDITISSGPAVISRVKILAHLDITEKRVPQDGRIKIKHDNREIDLRVSTMPTVFGEKAVIRILDNKSNIWSLGQLGFQGRNLHRIKEAVKSSHGMVLLTGPTGSGKTTTLYAVIKELNALEKNIVTIEDPVEYVLEKINQVQVNENTGLTFARVLRSVLRQDPDIIMVGEIRDMETAAMAVHAAVTGHLMLSTLHTTDAPGALVRLIDMGIQPYLVASSVVVVAAQRLVRKICPYCRESYWPEPGSTEYDFINSFVDEDIKLYKGPGCDYCNYTGYSGRISIQEIMPVTAAIRYCLKEKASIEEIREAALKEGMTSFLEDGVHKALQGITSVEEIMRAAR
ncbi:MAG: GspE/PulE family protein [Clostridiales bacterium]|nr:GspE/PulE family protein [Clostridiales bacterium]MCF8021149.1 GspE/PulE family protein [Clostridiales bacterium]